MALELEQLSPGARVVLEAMADGRPVLHGQHGFTRGAPVRRSGVIAALDDTVVEVSAAVMGELEAAGVSLETYEHNIVQGWKTIVVMPQRSAVKQALAACGPAAATAPRSPRM